MCQTSLPILKDREQLIDKRHQKVYESISILITPKLGSQKEIKHQKDLNYLKSSLKTFKNVMTIKLLYTN